MLSSVEITRGFTAPERDHVAALYWEAFGRKLRPAFRDADTGRAEVAASLRPGNVLVARRDGRVVGVCGFRSGGAGAVSGGGTRARLGLLGALRAALVLAPLRRGDVPGVLVLDGLCVDAGHRSAGIGSALLTAADALARDLGLRAVQLTVVDTNPRAEALYRRRGYTEVGHGDLGPLAGVYGFDRYRTLRRPVDAPSPARRPA
ncbi:GNAT family N-acetyltransferase [Kineococcus sp. SYSU DK001]|uniref:GNAT family N-acetyltransferase n=1 Tax=Kineococcus sp. SYSU DK001 TaxID=3383122 RepID=UPI003D7E25A7